MTGIKAAARVVDITNRWMAPAALPANKEMRFLPWTKWHGDTPMSRLPFCLSSLGMSCSTFMPSFPAVKKASSAEFHKGPDAN